MLLKRCITISYYSFKVSADRQMINHLILCYGKTIKRTWLFNYCCNRLVVFFKLVLLETHALVKLMLNLLLCFQQHKMHVKLWSGFPLSSIRHQPVFDSILFEGVIDLILLSFGASSVLVLKSSGLLLSGAILGFSIFNQHYQDSLCMKRHFLSICSIFQLYIFL